MPGPTDSSLGPEFEEYFRKGFRELVRFLMRIGATYAEAEDDAQEAMVRLLEEWDSVDTPSAWGKVVAVRLHIKHRTRRRLGDRLAAKAAMVLRGGQVASLSSDVASRDLVMRTIRGLPPAQAEVLALYFDGYSPTEIARLLGKNAAAVRSNLRHARKTLGAAFGDERRDGNREEGEA